MTTLFVDAETYSEVDLRKVGGRNYAEHPSTEVLLWSVRALDWPASLVFAERNLWHLLAMLKKSRRIEWTRNKPLDILSWGRFDLYLAQNTPGLASAGDGWLEKDGYTEGPNNVIWTNLQETSLLFGGPADLKNASAWWAGNEVGKLDGRGLINLFCMPNDDGKRTTEHDDPVRWAEFVAYAGRDTEVMIPIFEALRDMDEENFDHSDNQLPGQGVVARMNNRGMPIDRESCLNALSSLRLQERDIVTSVEDKFGFQPSQVAKVKEFLGTPDCKKETLEAFIETCGDPDRVELAEARLATAGAARKKLDPMINHSPNGFARDCFIYHGAVTRRLSSRAVQGQNFVRSPSSEEFFEKLNKGKIRGKRIFEDVRSNIRGFICAPEGKTLCASDYSAIELRVGAWLANETWLLDAFREGDDPYLEMATQLYREPVTEKSDPRRQLGKTVELAAIYQLSGNTLALQTMPLGIDLLSAVPRSLQRRILSIETDILKQQQRAGQEVIGVYRDRHPAIVSAWAICQKAWQQIALAEHGHYVQWRDITFERFHDYLRIERPGGFCQYYYGPRIVQGRWPDGGPKQELVYIGRSKGGAMAFRNTYGGDIFQSLCQGTAADLIIHGMGVAEAAGFPPVMSIHDEVVTLIDDGPPRHEELSTLLCQTPEWAEGLPVEAEGWQQRRFTK